MIERGWLSVSEAGRYVGISQDVIREAVYSGALPAYRKPVSRGRTASAEYNQHVYLKISRDDLDKWVRSWPEAVETK